MDFITVPIVLAVGGFVTKVFGPILGEWWKDSISPSLKRAALAVKQDFTKPPTARVEQLNKPMIVTAYRRLREAENAAKSPEEKSELARIRKLIDSLDTNRDAYILRYVAEMPNRSRLAKAIVLFVDDDGIASRAVESDASKPDEARRATQKEAMRVVSLLSTSEVATGIGDKPHRSCVFDKPIASRLSSIVGSVPTLSVYIHIDRWDEERCAAVP